MPRSALLLDGQALFDADRLLRSGLGERRASFELSIRRMPPHTGFAVVAGVETALERVGALLLDTAEIELARRACGASEELATRIARPVTLDIDVVPEGTLAFPNEPIASIEGPLFEAVVVGRLIQASIQRGTAIATRVARLHLASGGEPIIDGSSARAGSPDASIVVARAAFVGGAAGSTNPLACAALGIPFRAQPRLDIASLSSARGQPASGWGDAPTDRLIELGAGDDEEAILLEAKRLGTQAGGWIARGLADDACLPSMRYELIAIEEHGAWSPRRGASGDLDVLPGRKRAVRYVDAAGRTAADVVHLHNERMQAPKTVGAATLFTFARAVMRGGRMIEAAEPAAAGRDRAIAARQSLHASVTHLRRPTSYRVELSEGLKATIATS